jgi:hypothetical protein
MVGLRRSAIVALAVMTLGVGAISQSTAGAAPVRIYAAAHVSKSGSLAKVRAIKRGLQVAPPSRQYSKGKVKESLASKYAVRTGKKQLASLGFFDGSILHINQLTDAVLRSPSVTTLKRGEVDQITEPGSNHKISTAVAVASAIGTEWDTRCTKKLCVFTDVEGAVLVQGKVGAPVTITTGQQTTVRKGKAPTRPTAADAAAVTSWVHVLPPAPPSLGVNLGLSANGGSVVPSSTRATSAGKSWDVSRVNDGDTSTGWQTAQGRTTNQTLTFSFGSGNVYEITGIVIDPAATGGEDASNDLKDFAVQGSRDGNGYATAFTGATKQQDGLQAFSFPAAVDADHVRLQLVDNWGGTDGIAASEVEIVGHKIAVATPKPTNTPLPTSTPRPTNTPLPTSVSNRIFSIDITAPPYSYTEPGYDPTTEVDHLVAQTCGPDPFTNLWNGQLTYHGVDQVNGSTGDGSYTFPPVRLSPGTPGTIFTGNANADGTPSGHSDLTVSAGPPYQALLRFYPNPEFSPIPSMVQASGAVSVGAAC